MLGNEKLWSCTPIDGSVLPNGVQVGAGWLDVGDAAIAGFWPTLCSQERERADRFAFEPARARFIAARGLLRTIMATCLGTLPRSVEFSYSSTGKPSLGGAFASGGLEFNLAHSGDLVVFAVAGHGVVGVDVEQVRSIPELSTLSQRFFSPGECAEIEKLSGEEAARGFFRIWTRKEAWLKATGEGIAGLRKSLEVCGPAGDGELCGGPQDGSGGTRLRLHDLAPAPGFLGALAVAL